MALAVFWGGKDRHDLLAEADRAGIPVDLQVLKVNPARVLYNRLGFREVQKTETHILMRIWGRHVA